MPGGAGGYLPPVVISLLADAGPGIAKLQEFKAILAEFASRDYTARIGVEVDAASLAAAGTAAGAAAGGGGRGGLGALLMGMFMGKGGGLRLGLPFGAGIGFAGLGSLGSLAGFGAEHMLMTLLGLGGSAAGGAIGGGLLGLGALGTMGVGMGSDMLVMKSTIADTKTLVKAYENLAKARAVYGAGSRQAAIAQEQLNYQIASMGGASQVGVAAEMKLAQAAMHFGAVWDKVTQQARASFVNNLALPVLQMAQGYLPLIADAANRNFGIIGNAIKPLLTFLGTQGHAIFADLENVFARDLPISTGIFVQSLELILKTIDHIATTANFGSFLQRILDFVTRLNTTGFGHFMNQVDSLIRLFHVWAAFIGVLGRDIYLMFSQTLGLGTGIIQSLTVMLQKLGQWEQSVQGRTAMHNLFEVHKQEILELLKLIPLLVQTFGPIYIQLSTIFTRIAIPLIVLTVAVVDFLTHIGLGVGNVISFALALGLIQLKTGLVSTAFALAKGAWLIAAEVILRLRLAFISLAEGEGIATAAGWLFNGTLLVNPIFWVVAGIAVLILGLYLLVTHLKEVGDWLRATYERFHGLIDVILFILGPIGLVIRVIGFLIGHLKDFIVWASKLPVVGGLFKGMADSVSQSAATMQAAVSQHTKQMSTDVATNFGAMSATGKGDMSSLSQSVFDLSSQMNQRTVRQTTTMKLQLIQQFQDLFGKGSALTQRLSWAVESNYVDMKNKGTTYAEEMRQQMILEITQLYGEGTAQTKAMVNQINTVFAQLGPDGLVAGQALGQGVVNGILSKYGAIYGAVAGIVVQALATLKKLGRIGSPSQETYWIGQMLIQGLANGIIDSQHLAINAMAKVGQGVLNAGRVRPGFGGPPTAGGYAFAGAGGGSLTIYSNPTINITGAAGHPQQVGQAVQKALDKHTADLVKMLKAGVYLPGQGLP